MLLEKQNCKPDFLLQTLQLAYSQRSKCQVKRPFTLLQILDPTFQISVCPTCNAYFSLVLVPDYAAADVFVKNIHSCPFSPPGNISESILDISESILDIGYRSSLDISERIVTFFWSWPHINQLFSAFWDFSLVFWLWDVFTNPQHGSNAQGLTTSIRILLLNVDGQVLAGDHC